MENKKKLGLKEKDGSDIHLKVRCDYCGKVMVTISEYAGRNMKCPECSNSIQIPNTSEIKMRKTAREVVHESEMSTHLPETLRKPEITPLYRIVYTEVLPANFALKRNNVFPLLDLSENGLGFICKEKDALKLKIDEIVPIEVDFPILEEPLKLQVQVRWLKQMSNKKLYRIGVEFHQPERELHSVLDTLYNYITSRPELW